MRAGICRCSGRGRRRGSRGRIAVAVIWALWERTQLGISLSWALVVETIVEFAVGVIRKQREPLRGAAGGVNWLILRNVREACDAERCGNGAVHRIRRTEYRPITIFERSAHSPNRHARAGGARLAILRLSRD